MEIESQVLWNGDGEEVKMESEAIGERARS